MGTAKYLHGRQPLPVNMPLASVARAADQGGLYEYI